MDTTPSVREKLPPTNTSPFFQQTTQPSLRPLPCSVAWPRAGRLLYCVAACSIASPRTGRLLPIVSPLLFVRTRKSRGKRSPFLQIPRLAGSGGGAHVLEAGPRAPPPDPELLVLELLQKLTTVAPPPGSRAPRPLSSTGGGAAAACASAARPPTASDWRWTWCRGMDLASVDLSLSCRFDLE
ncbi:uncharacterized protein LOC119351565 [Triticum dicoccoides]|uniref:uncharacterized protein LOC119351565 n=1 Tax=Triticum dicoccoides TaxID=85692 RepID=UPI00188F3F2C|nr:uncharacterized protein LOC119351565 [Triticum dicoccoides]